MAARDGITECKRCGRFFNRFAKPKDGVCKWCRARYTKNLNEQKAEAKPLKGSVSKMDALAIYCPYCHEFYPRDAYGHIAACRERYNDRQGIQ